VRLPPVALAYVVGGALSTVEGGMGVLLPPYLQANGYPAAIIGVFVSLYAVSAIASRLPAGRWYRPGWVRWLLVSALLTQAATNLGYPLFHDLLPLVAIRVVTGFAYGLGTTVNLAQFLDALPPGTPRDRPTALYTAAVSLGFATGNVTSGLLAQQFGYFAGFLGTSTYAVVAAAMTLCAAEPPVGRAGNVGRGGPGAVLRALGEPRLLIVLIEVFLLNFLFGLQYALFPLYLIAVGAALAQLGVIRGLFSGSQILSRVGAGWLTARFGYQSVAGWALVAQIVALMAVPATSSLLVLTALSVAYGVARGATMMANTLGLAAASDRSTLGRGAASGIYNAAADAGTLVGPLVAGAAADAVGIGRAFVLLPLGVLVAYATSLWLNQRRRAVATPAVE
jgi:predicted MFS family arabinose efflux permease